MQVELRDRPFEPWEAVRKYEEDVLGHDGKLGACAVFVGSMRDFNEGQHVRAMMLEHYPGMTERQLERIAEQAGQRWNAEDALVIHRIGSLEPNDCIVLVAVWSAHRAPAFAACRYIVEELKSRAPFWKKETLSTGEERWVSHNTAG